MVSKQLLDELNTILKEDYSLELSAYDLSNLGNSLAEWFAILKGINQNDNDKRQSN